MSAPNLATLYDFETQIESAVASILTAGGVTVAGTSRADVTLVTPCCEVLCHVGGPYPTSAPNFFAVGTDYRPCTFSGTVQIRILTDRKRNPSSHGPFRGGVRALLYAFVSKFTNTNLPYLEIFDAQDAGAFQEVDDGRGLDTTTLSWEVRFAILPTAWPT